VTLEIICANPSKNGPAHLVGEVAAVNPAFFLREGVRWPELGTL
jgi:hypothetical protein